MCIKLFKLYVVTFLFLSSTWSGPDCLADVVVAIHLDGSGSTMGSTFSDLGAVTAQVAASESFTGNGNQSSVVSSQVSDGFDSFIRQSARATSDRATTFAPSGDAFATALYEDTITLNGNGVLPDEIRLNFHVTGTMSQEITMFGGFARTSFGVRASSNPDDFAGQLNAPFFAENPYFDSGVTYDFSTILDVETSNNNLPTEGWDSLEFGPDGEFEGTFSYVVDLNSDLETYDFGFIFSTMATVKGGIAESNLGNSIGLLNVTNADGSALSGFAPVFASGRSFANVPEPGVMGMGCVVLVGWIARRRRS